MSSSPQELKVKFTLVPETVQESFSKRYTEKFGYYRGEPGGYLIKPNYALNGSQKIFNLKPRQDDVWLVTFPKTGI